MTFANTAPSGEATRQSKALERYEAQRAVWDRVQNNLAKKLNRPDPAETLPGSVHHYRLRKEELGILDAAIPSSMKSGGNAWEMSLRGGAGGVRFVQIGKAYPYPLYCPIRDPDTAPLDSNTFMRMIPMDKVPTRNKPTAESEYFHDRQEQFRKFVQKKFSHFHEHQDGMVITGRAPPTSASPIHENMNVEPVVFIPTEASAPRVPSSNGHPVTQYVTDEPKSRPLSAITGTPAQQSVSRAGQTVSGPMLCFSTSQVSFSTAPGESSQGSIKVDNIGTTAVYYSWAVVPQVPLLDDAKQPDHFYLSDSSSGVLLPEEQKQFTFTVRAPIPGVFTKQYELLTIPAGKERIIVNLRAVVISNEVNDVATRRLEAELHKKAIRDYQRHFITEPMWNPDNLVLDHANVEIEIRDLTKAKAKRLAELRGVGEFQEGNWNDRNAPLRLPYNEAVYSKIVLLHRQFHQFLASVTPPPSNASYYSVSQQASGDGRRSPPISVPLVVRDWDGSVKSILEDVTMLKDISARNTFMSALQSLLGCAEVSQDKSETLHVLLARSAGRKAWAQAIDEMHRYTSVARDLAEGKSIKAKVDKVETKGAKPPPKAAAKPAPKGAAASPLPSEAKAEGSPDVKHPLYDKFFYAGVRRIVGDAVEAIFGRQEAVFDTIAAVTDRPFECSVRRRLDVIASTQAAPDPEPEVVPDNSKQKKK